MERGEELGLIREVIGLADRKSAYLDDTIAHSPIARYSSSERFDREKDMIFRRKPIIAAHSSELDQPRAFLTRTLFDLPVLLSRDENGSIRAFLNVCRHRGQGWSGQRPAASAIFTCPYHGWSWTNHGELRAVPMEKQGFPDLPRADRGLRRLPVAEAHGFVWIIADPDEETPLNVDTWLDGLSPDFEWLDLSGHRIAVEETFDIRANWKLLIEGGLEAYHFRVAHKDTIAPYFPDNLSTYQMFGAHIRSVLPRSTMTGLKNIPEEKWSIRRDANILYTLLPTTQLLVQQDHVVWVHTEPRAEDLTTIQLATLVPTGEPDTEDRQAHWVRNHAITRTTLMEDFELGEEIQSGFASRGNPSHLFGRFEGALNRFNLLVEDMIGA